MAEQPCAQDIAPVRRQGVRREGIEGEDPFGEASDRGDRSLGVALEDGAIGLDEEKVGVRRDGVERMPGRQPDPGEEIATAAGCGRLAPDQPAAGDEAGLEDLLHLLVLAL